MVDDLKFMVVAGSLDDLFEQLNSCQIQDYIVKIRYKYKWETKWRVSCEYLQWDWHNGDYVWLNDWHEGEEDVFVEWFTGMENLEDTGFPYCLSPEQIKEECKRWQS